MGLMEKIGFGGEGEEKKDSSELAEDFTSELGAEEFETHGEEFEEETVEEEEPKDWDTAYRFAEEMLEPDGHANMMDFANSFMFHKVSQSPMFRDRIQHGTETINSVASAKERMDKMKGRRGETNFEEMAEKMEAANRAIDAADKLGGREEAMMQDAMALGTELVQVAADAVQNSGGRVDSRVTETEERI